MKRSNKMVSPNTQAHGFTLVDLLVAVSIMSIALLVFLSAALTARGVIDKSQFTSIASNQGGTQAANALASATTLSVGTTSASVPGIPQGLVSQTVSTYGGSSLIKRADISLSWGSASSKTVFSAGGFNFSTLQSVPSHVSAFYNAGVDNASALLSQGALDTHWTILNYAGAPYVGPLYVAVPDPYWTARTSTCQWISPSPIQSQTMPSGTYVYRTTFTLAGPTTNVTLTVNGSYDDKLTQCKLNGVTVPGTSNIGNWTTWVSFIISSGFVSGVNTLDFYVPNPTSGPTGLQVQLVPSS